MVKRAKSRIERFAEDFYSLMERESTSDIGSLFTRMVYESILKSDALSPRDRQVYGMSSCLCLNQSEIAEVLGISQQAVSPRVNRCYESIVNALRGTYIVQAQDDDYIYDTYFHPVFDEWNAAVVRNEGEWWDVPEDVRLIVLQHWGLHSSDVHSRDYDDSSEVDELDGYRYIGYDPYTRKFWDADKMESFSESKLVTRTKPKRSYIPTSKVKMPNWNKLKGDNLLGLPQNPKCPFLYGDL